MRMRRHWVTPSADADWLSASSLDLSLCRMGFINKHLVFPSPQVAPYPVSNFTVLGQSVNVYLRGKCFFASLVTFLNCVPFQCHYSIHSLAWDKLRWKLYPGFADDLIVDKKQLPINRFNILKKSQENSNKASRTGCKMLQGKPPYPHSLFLTTKISTGFCPP